jgi:hypothetical protein
MQYVAELLTPKGAIATTDFEAVDDADARLKGEDWAVPQLAEMIGSTVRLQVVQNGRGVHSKEWGQIQKPRRQGEKHPVGAP